MKNLKIIALITLFLCIPVFLLTIFDFLALHDIHHEYVSKDIIDHLRVKIELAPFTNNVMEWRMVVISFYSRFVFFIFNIAVLVYFIKKLQINKIPDRTKF